MKSIKPIIKTKKSSKLKTKPLQGVKSLLKGEKPKPVIAKWPDRKKWKKILKNPKFRLNLRPKPFNLKIKLNLSKQKSWLQTSKKYLLKKKKGKVGPTKKIKTWLKKNKQKKAYFPKYPKLSRFLKIILFPIVNPFLRYGLLLLFLLSLGGVIYILRDLPSPRRMTSKENFPVSTLIYDRNGKLLYEIFGEENRIPVKLETLPSHVYQASIAIEDKNFYKHWGFDIEGIIRAIRTNIQGTGSVHGGSTITQQLVKNALLTPEKSVKRKIKEGVLAIFTELLYTKEEILEMYLNYISYGGTSLGIQAASQRYFGKNANELDLAEAALLAGLPQAPSRYSPFGSNPEQAKTRQNDVLRRMEEDGYITKVEAETAKAQILEYAISQTEIKAPHFVFYVRDLLYEKFGEEVVQQGGMRVTTSLDLDLQQTAQASLSAEIKKIKNRFRANNGAAIITKPNTGEILAMIGSKDYFNATDEGQVNVTLAERQPGSSIKPLMYAVTFQEKTLNPGTVLLDIPTCFTIPNQKDYCPKNYDGNFKGPVTVRQSLGNSLNITAVKALSTVGVTNFINHANEMGISSWVDPSNYGLSLTLGGGEVRMIDMASAFGTLANQGVKVPLTPILKIEDYQGKLIEKSNIEQTIKDLNYLTTYDDEYFKGDLNRVMDRAPAYMTSHIMQDDNARKAVFGPNSKLVIPGQVVSAKTGTTNNMKDNWTIGFTPEFLVAVWVGNNDGTPMSSIASGITGAAPIWHNIMTYVLRDQEPIWQEKPDDVMSAKVCISGMPPELTGENCSPKHTEMFWIKSRPSKSQMLKQQIWVKPETGLPPAPGESTDGLILEERIIYQDPVTDNYCSDCNRATTEEGKTVYEKQTVNTDEILQRLEEMMQ